MAQAGRAPPWQLVTAALDHRIVKAVLRAARQLAVSCRAVRPDALASCPPPGTVYCLGSRLALQFHRLSGPTIVVCAGATIKDDALVRLTVANAVPIRAAELSGRTLLRCLLQLASGGRRAEELSDWMMADPRVAKLPELVIEVFLAEPARIWTLAHLAEKMGIPIARTLALVHEAGFTDVRHLYTALRARSWVWLVPQMRLDRRTAERYLGITHRPSFQRSCNRAGLPVPWEAKGDLSEGVAAPMPVPK